MFFKKNTLFAMLSLTGFVSVSALAADGTVNFQGKISDAPCIVSIPSQDQNMMLGTVPSADLATSGDRSTAKNFQIDLLNCTAAVKSAKISFGGSSPIGDPTLLTFRLRMASTRAPLQLTWVLKFLMRKERCFLLTPCPTQLL